MIPLEKIPRGEILHLYMSAVKNLGTQNPQQILSIDGATYNVIEVGKFLASHFNTRSFSAPFINQVWGDLQGRFSDLVWRTNIKPEIAAIVAQMPVEITHDTHVEKDETKPKLGGRERPVFEDPYSDLDRVYNETLQKGEKTFKLTLWRNTPEFRKMAQEQYGFDIATFWNLNDPDSVVAAVNKLSTNPTALKYIDTALKARFGISLENLPPDDMRAIADEVVQAAHQAVKEGLHNITRGPDFLTMVSRFQDLLGKAATIKSPKVRAELINNVSHLLKQNGINLPPNPDVATLTSLLNDEGVINQAQLKYRINQELQSQALGSISTTFDLDNRPVGIRLISRTEDDQYLGDLTGDCTSYSLKTGFNAWTVPVLLTNPGFVYFVMEDEENNSQFLAKTGLVLSVLNGNIPAIDGDSFETSNTLPTTAEGQAIAKAKISKKLMFLKAWAERIGVAPPFMNTIANSSDATTLLYDETEEGPQYRSLEPMGGLSGVAELRKNLVGGNPVAETIYYQATDRDMDDEAMQQRIQDVETQHQREKSLRTFEKYINDTVSRLDDKEAVKFQQDVKDLKWDSVFTTIMRIRAPYVSQLLGADVHKWEAYMDILRAASARGQDTISYDDEDQILQNFEIDKVIDSLKRQESVKMDLSGEGILQNILYSLNSDDFSVGRIDSVELARLKTGSSAAEVFMGFLIKAKDQGLDAPKMMRMLYEGTSSASTTEKIRFLKDLRVLK